MPEITFNELDELADRDPLKLSAQDIDNLILGMRAYRNKTLGGKATKFSDEAKQPTVDIKALAAFAGAPAAAPFKRRI